MIEPHEIESLIRKALPDCTLTVTDLTGTLDHYQVIVVSSAFDGKRLVQRHQVINQILAEPLKGPLHALSIQAHTPAEWEQKKNDPNASGSNFSGGTHGHF